MTSDTCTPNCRKLKAAEDAREKAEKALRIVQNAAKSLSKSRDTELQHLRENAAFDHRLRAQHESLQERDGLMTDALLKVEAERDAARAEVERLRAASAKQAGAYLDAQKDACARFGLEPGKLQWAWRQGERTDKSETEWAIVDALAMGGIAAWPGDGVGCAAQIVWYWMGRADAADASLLDLRARIAEAVNAIWNDTHKLIIRPDESQCVMIPRDDLRRLAALSEIASSQGSGE